MVYMIILLKNTFFVKAVQNIKIGLYIQLDIAVTKHCF